MSGGSMQVLADIFPHAHSDQDGKLTLAELECFLSLIELEATCTYLVGVTDAGRNLFCHLDTNGDGLLEKKPKATAKLLAECRGVRNHMGLPRLTKGQILTWADSHKQPTGKWPT